MHDTKNFKTEEFTCKCGCGLNAVSQELVDMLQELRDACGFALTISSGCRCKHHNLEEGGEVNSEHLANPLTMGADIEVPSSIHRFTILNNAFKLGFQRIGIGKHFIHLGINSKLPTKVVWMY